MKPGVNNTFCFLPFHQIALKNWSNGQLESAAPCCNSIRPDNSDPLHIGQHALSQMSPDEIFNSTSMAKLRSDLLAGIKNPACNTCWRLESQGLSSYRLHSAPHASINLNLSIEEPQLCAIDMTFGEDCNLRCRMCTPGNSNKLRIDQNFFRINKTQGAPSYIGWGDVYEDPNETFYFSINSKHYQDLIKNIHAIKILKSTGGETLRTQGFNLFIDTAIEQNAAKDIVLMYHTNATRFTDKMIDKLARFKQNIPTFSIDSVGKNYEYIRYPMPWDKLEMSVDNFLRKISIDTLSFNSTVTAYNFEYIIELCEWIYDKTKTVPNLFTNVHFDCVWPAQRAIDIDWLPPHILRSMQQKILDFSSKNRSSAIHFNFNSLSERISTILKNQSQASQLFLLDKRKQLLAEIKAFDQARNQNFRQFLTSNMIQFLELIDMEPAPTSSRLSFK